MKKVINLLMLGNSYSIDVATYMHKLSLNSDVEIRVGVLYIGGCSLETHWNNIVNDAPLYAFAQNGETWDEGYTVKKALLSRKWDYISLQQASHFSGFYDSYFPYITNIMTFFREYSDAKFIINETWGYTNKWQVPAFLEGYKGDTEYMVQVVRDAYHKVMDEINVHEFVPCLEVIYQARKKYGLDMSPEGLHLDNIGRYLTGLAWVYHWANRIDSLYYPTENLWKDYDCKVPTKEECEEYHRFIKEFFNK